MHKVCFEDCGITLIKQVNFSHNNIDPTTTFSFTFRVPVFEHTKDLTLNPLQWPEGGSPDHIEDHCLPHLAILDISVAGISCLGQLNSHSPATLVTALRNYKLQVLPWEKSCRG